MRFNSFIIIILLSYLLVGCDNKPPDGWQMPTLNNDINIISKRVFLDAKNSEWTPVMDYDQRYNYEVKVFASSPSFNPDAYKAMATGNIVLCNEGCYAFNGINSNSSSEDGKVEYRIVGESGYITAQGKIDSPINAGPYALGTRAIIKAGQSGNLQFKISDTYYLDNYGQYEVIIEYPQQDSSFVSKIASAVLNPITSQIRAVSIQFWDTFVSNPTTRSILAAMMVLYLMIKGIYIIGGAVKVSHHEVVSIAIKFGIITALISPLSYNFFNEYLFQIFVEGQADLINAITAPDSSILRTGVLNYDSAFKFTNFVINTIFSSHFLIILVSFLLWFPAGWICLILLVVAFIEYSLAIIEAFILYLIATTAVQLMIAMGPIFISLLLFEKTKEYFNKWLEVIISFAMQPVVLFACIMFIGAMISGSLMNIMSIKLDWGCVLDFYINLGPNPFDSDNNITIPLGCLSWYKPIVNGFVDVIIDVLIFYLLVALLKKITGIATEISSQIFGGGKMLGEASKIASSAGSLLRNVIKRDTKEMVKQKQLEQQENKKGGSQDNQGDKKSRDGIKVTKDTKKPDGVAVKVQNSGSGSIKR